MPLVLHLHLHSRELTRPLHVLIHDHKMTIPPVCSPASDPTHLETFALLPPNELRTWEDANELVAEVIGCARSLGRGGDKNFWRDTGVQLAREVGGEWVRSDVSGGLVLGLFRMRIRRIGGGRGIFWNESRWASFWLGVGVCGQNGWVVLAGVVKSSGDILCEAFLM